MSSERDKRYRQRSKAGVRVVPVELPAKTTEVMVWRGLIAGAHRMDSRALSTAVRKIIEAWVSTMPRDATRRG